MKDCIEVSS